MNYKFIPRFYYSLSFYAYLQLFKNNIVSKRKKLKETAIKEDAFIFNNARVGLRLLLNSIPQKSLKIGIQAYTCRTVFQAIQKAGHQIVFIDLDNELKLDLGDLKRKLKNIDVLIVTHTFGYPEDIDQIKKLIGNKILIEDCAHSFLSKYKGGYTGDLGDAAIFSTGLGKFPPIGSGGFCVINKPDKFPLLGKEYDKIPHPGTMSSLKEFFKAILLSFMMKRPLYGALTYPIGKRFDTRIDFVNKFSFSEFKGYTWTQNIFKNNATFFNRMLIKQTDNAKLLSSLIRIKNPVLDCADAVLPNFYAFPLLTDKRDNLYDKLLENNIEPGKHFYKSIEWASEFGYKKGDCPNTELIVKKIITVPIHCGVSKKTIQKIAEIINETNEIYKELKDNNKQSLISNK